MSSGKTYDSPEPRLRRACVVSGLLLPMGAGVVVKQTSEEPIQAVEDQPKSGQAPINVAQRPFDPNIEGAIARLHLSGGAVLFCDVVLLTSRDLVVTIPKSEAIPDRGDTVRCSLFLTEDDSYVAHREGVVHWEMALHGQRLAGIFLSEKAPVELLDLTDNDRRREVRFPANLACRIGDVPHALQGRLVNYSLNGLATQSAEPMCIGENYRIELDAGDEEIKVEATCRWSIATAYGFTNGYSFANGEGELFARRVFRGSVMPWDINQTRSQPAGHMAIDSEEESVPIVVGEPIHEKPLLSSTTILLLSATLIGLSIRTPEELSQTIFLGGIIGLVTYIGLVWTARMRELKRQQKIAATKRAAAETRLRAHVSTDHALVRPNREKTDSDES